MISYDLFTSAFLEKVREFEFMKLQEADRTAIVDGYMKRAASEFKKNCKYNLTSSYDDETRSFNIDVDVNDIDELVDIISDGMLVQWMKPYAYQQENLQNCISTRDFSQYSPAELLSRVGNAYAKAQRDYTQAIREYSYNHGDLSDLHL